MLPAYRLRIPSLSAVQLSDACTYRVASAYRIDRPSFHTAIFGAATFRAQHPFMSQVKHFGDSERLACDRLVLGEMALLSLSATTETCLASRPVPGQLSSESRRLPPISPARSRADMNSLVADPRYRRLRLQLETPPHRHSTGPCKLPPGPLPAYFDFP